MTKRRKRSRKVSSSKRAKIKAELERRIVPKTELARLAIEARADYIAAGGRLYTLDEINAMLGRGDG